MNSSIFDISCYYVLKTNHFYLRKVYHQLNEHVLYWFGGIEFSAEVVCEMQIRKEPVKSILACFIITLLRSLDIYVQYRSDIKNLTNQLDYGKMGCLKSWNAQESKSY